MTRPSPGPSVASIFRGSFGGGILSPVIGFRADMEKWQVGAANLTNFFVHVQGGISNRSGTQYIGEQAGTGNPAKLIPFVFNNEQGYILEMGAGYIRFIYRGAYITNGDGSIYQIGSPYGWNDVFSLRYDQSADVMTITHPGYTPYELKRYADTNWTLAQVSFASGIAAPTMTEVTAENGTAASSGTTPAVPQEAYAYNVTAASTSLSTESNTSGNGLSVANYNIGYFQQYGNFNTVNWSQSEGADYYNVYRLYAGQWGLIGTTAGLSFDDKNYAPDTTNGPPQHRSPFDGGNYPTAVCYFQQRHVFAGSNQNPQTVYATRSANYHNFDVHTPVRDDDAITATIAAQQVQNIKHLVSMADLLAFTGAGIWKIAGGQTGTAITPSNFTATPQLYVGSSDVRPIAIKNNVLFIEGMGSHVRELQYDYYASVYTGTDLSLYAESLFYGYQISDWAYAEFPFAVLWACRSDGTLLGMTYLKEQNVWAWHQHETQGSVLSVATIPEPNQWGAIENVLYLLVQRSVDGSFRYYIERMVSRQMGADNNDISQSWFVDCGLRYSGAPVSRVSGLDHLEGSIVSACIDGKGYSGLAVQSGAVNLPVAGSIVTVGLPYTAHARTLPMDMAQPPMFSRKKRISRVYCSLYNTVGLEVSSNDGADLFPLGETAESGAYGGLYETRVPSAKWTQLGQFDFYQRNPLPCTISTFSFSVEVGEQQ